MYIERGNAKSALAHLQAVFKADPRDAATLELLAQAFKVLGQLKKAASVYQELVLSTGIPKSDSR
jgi:Tfp pilus assembly protein PilF